MSYCFLSLIRGIFLFFFFFNFSRIKGTQHEGDMHIYCLQLILDLKLRTNTHERRGTRTRAPDLPVRYRTNEQQKLKTQVTRTRCIIKTFVIGEIEVGDGT